MGPRITKRAKKIVDIIVYDYTLRNVGCLRKSMIDIIKDKLPSLECVLD